VPSGGGGAIEEARSAARAVLAGGVRYEAGVEKPLGDKGRRTRDTILRAAGETFMDLGWGAATIGAIAERAGVGTGTLYQYFRAKEDVLAALVGEWVLAALEQLRAWDPHEGREGLRRILGRFVAGYAATHRFQAVWEELTNVEPTLLALRMQLTDAYVAIFAEAFTAGAAEGLCDPGDDPAETARALCAMTDRYCHQVFVQRRDHSTPERTTDLLTDLWARAIRLG
jgi:AcrR family transcriptional regulator